MRLRLRPRRRGRKLRRNSRFLLFLVLVLVLSLALALVLFLFLVLSLTLALVLVLILILNLPVEDRLGIEEIEEIGRGHNLEIEEIGGGHTLEIGGSGEEHILENGGIGEGHTLGIGVVQVHRQVEHIAGMQAGSLCPPPSCCYCQSEAAPLLSELQEVGCLVSPLETSCSGQSSWHREPRAWFLGLCDCRPYTRKWAVQIANKLQFFFNFIWNKIRSSPSFKQQHENSKVSKLDELFLVAGI